MSDVPLALTMELKPERADAFRDSCRRRHMAPHRSERHRDLERAARG